MAYDESDGPTKADNGEGEDQVIQREEDINDRSDKASGWTNPLSWTDDGTDDNLVLNMQFQSLN